MRNPSIELDRLRTEELDPEAARLREIRRQRRELITRVVLIFAAWCVVVIVFALAMGARP